MKELSKETVKRIEEDANSYAGKYNIASIASMVYIGYMAGATAEATRSMIVEAEKDKEYRELGFQYGQLDAQFKQLSNDYQQLTAERDERNKTIEKQEETINTYYDLNNSLGDKIRELTSERDAYKEKLERLVSLKDYKDKNGKDVFYEEVQPLAWKAAREVLNQFNNTENKKQ